MNYSLGFGIHAFVLVWLGARLFILPGCFLSLSFYMKQGSGPSIDKTRRINAAKVPRIRKINVMSSYNKENLAIL